VKQSKVAQNIDDQEENEKSTKIDGKQKWCHLQTIVPLCRSHPITVGGFIRRRGIIRRRVIGETF
jgi:hypothetical protein